MNENPGGKPNPPNSAELRKAIRAFKVARRKVKNHIPARTRAERRALGIGRG